MAEPLSCVSGGLHVWLSYVHQHIRIATWIVNRHFKGGGEGNPYNYHALYSLKSYCRFTMSDEMGRGKEIFQLTENDHEKDKYINMQMRALNFLNLYLLNHKILLVAVQCEY